MALNQDWLLFKQGDQGAFERIYQELVDDLYAYGKKFSKDNKLVEDCIQDMFLDLWDKRIRLGETNNVKAYLFVTLRRRIIKTLKRGSVVSLVDEVEVFQAELSIDLILEQIEMKKENGIKLKNAFDSLTKKQQHILYLKFYQSFNNHEIAEMLKINYQSARNALNRALTQLKKNILLILLLFLEIYKIN